MSTSEPTNTHNKGNVFRVGTWTLGGVSQLVDFSLCMMNVSTYVLAQEPKSRILESLTYWLMLGHAQFPWNLQVLKHG